MQEKFEIERRTIYTNQVFKNPVVDTVVTLGMWGLFIFVGYMILYLGS